MTAAYSDGMLIHKALQTETAQLQSIFDDIVERADMLAIGRRRGFPPRVIRLMEDDLKDSLVELCQAIQRLMTP